MPATKRLVKVDNCGTGCVIYTREVIEKCYRKYDTIYEFETQRYLINDIMKRNKLVSRESIPIIEVYNKFFFPYRDESCAADELKIKYLDVNTIPQDHYKVLAFGEDIFAHKRMKAE